MFIIELYANEKKKSYGHTFIHVMIEFYLAFFGLILYFNLPSPGGIIAIISILVIMLIYFIMAVRPLSNYNIWLEKKIYNFNLKSLAFTKDSPEDRKKGIIILSISAIDLILFVVFQLTGYIVVANICIIVGKIFRVIGFRRLFRGLDNESKGHTILLYAIITIIPTYPPQIALYFLNIISHLF